MSYAEKVYEDHLEFPLKELIIHAQRMMTRPERGRLLILLAKDMDVFPKHLVKASLDWRAEG